MSELFVHRYGATGGSPLLAIHGVSAHGRRFELMAPAAFPGAEVLAPDLRGHGRSPADPPSTIERHVADLLGVLDRAEVDRAVLVGHSYGACIAAHLLAQAPDRVRCVVLLDPAMALPPGRAQEMSDGMLASDIGYPTLDDLVVARQAGRSAAAIVHSDADTRLAAVKGPTGWKTPWDRDVVAQAWREMARPMPTLATPRPTLLVEAMQAQLVTDLQRDHLRSQLGDALTVVAIDLGHMLYWDDFDASCTIIRDFLAAHAPETVVAR